MVGDKHVKNPALKVTHTHTHTHMRTHARTHACTHAHTHTHTQSLPQTQGNDFRNTYYLRINCVLVDGGSLNFPLCCNCQFTDKGLLAAYISVLSAPRIFVTVGMLTLYKIGKDIVIV